MATVNYLLPYEINSELVISPSELRELMLFGIDFTDNGGNEYPDSAIEYHIKNAQEEVEDFLNIKLQPQVIEDTYNFDYRDYVKYGEFRTDYPVRKAFKLTGQYGNSDTNQIEYPADWLVSRRTNDPIGWERCINIVPSGESSATFTSQAIFTLLYPSSVYQQGHVPEYFTLTYTTGFDEVPRDVLAAITKLATINILTVLGESSPIGSGIASRNLSIDGLSQGISTTSSSTSSIFGARILQTGKELQKELPRLRQRYVGYLFSAL
tara:strand:+ start:12182 stop:12979 length:798 start_codon:yes stop_codon:yes gene_type:complete